MATIDFDAKFSSNETGTWVKLLARDVRIAPRYSYYSEGASNQGNFTIPDVPVGVIYDMETAPSKGGPWVKRAASSLIANPMFQMADNANALKIGGNTGRPIVSGSRGGNAALASLLTALANAGLITDSTTA